ncbi:MAG: protein-tyrosine-phosphatase [Sporocytophaga sp.]|uniref:protein-tyrosine-phosphatase n=1 Tax=Sporocytophaga sp. TaxID=2231183 RepID=UPI001B2CC9AC|nr:protein-tyrosine-phosphatase [Sporocytophaga sp.]MBO9702581.1 protein-tyrosine-phosphatase [Sporocytophaga sp.]
MLFQSIESYIQNAIRSFDSISVERKKTLETISQFVQEKLDAGKSTELIYICTHNSRRSHLGQIWGKTAARYYGITNINTYSAGTETTAFNPNAIKSIEKAGYKVSKSTGEEKNPQYSVTYDDKEVPIICFSKTYEDASIPKVNLCAIMTCTEADGNCPIIPGTELRISCSYVDPKAFDGTPQQEEKYDERCKQIAIENLYIFSLVRN